jgi:protein TonB
MSNTYLLPVCFAAAAHGALLFGFTKQPRPARIVATPTMITPFVLRAEEPPPEIAVDAADRSEAKAAAPDRPAIPRGEEPLVVDLGTQPIMPRPDMIPVTFENTDRILPSDLGVPGGKGNEPWRNGIVRGEFLDNPPRTRFQASPIFPHQATREGLSGEVLVDFVVDERGRVLNPRIVKSSNPMFDEPTLRAIARWQFEPGRRGGEVVKFRMTVPVVFNVQDRS